MVTATLPSYTAKCHFKGCGGHVSLTNSSVAAELEDLPLSANKTDMATIVKVMQLPDSGLEIRDRMWLKITIANAVIGKKCRTESTVHT